jgi:hypothetical protein
LDLRSLDELRDLGEVAAVEELDDVLVEAGFDEDVADLLDDGWRLGRGLEDDTVAGEESGDEGVREDEVWVLRRISMVIARLEEMVMSLRSTRRAPV